MKRPIQVGDRIRNEAIGEEYTFRATAASTGGAYLAFDNVAPAGLAGPPAHVHRQQEERFTVLAGTLTLLVAGERRVLQAGETAIVPPGVAHTFDNRQGQAVTFRVMLTPALDSEQFFAGVIALANAAGRAQPPLRQLARLVQPLDAKFELAYLPRWMQAPLFSLLAKI